MLKSRWNKIQVKKRWCIKVYIWIIWCIFTCITFFCINMYLIPELRLCLASTYNNEVLSIFSKSPPLKNDSIIQIQNLMHYFSKIMLQYKKNPKYSMNSTIDISKWNIQWYTWCSKFQCKLLISLLS